MAQAGKKTRWAEVTCHIHGKQDPDQKVAGWKPKQVKVTVPNTKRDRRGGCPQCRKESNRAKLN